MALIAHRARETKHGPALLDYGLLAADLDAHEGDGGNCASTGVLGKKIPQPRMVGVLIVVEAGGIEPPQFYGYRVSACLILPPETADC
jgi:hypothetical protein